MLHALGEYGAVIQLKSLQGSEQGIAFCEYSKVCAARMVRRECKQAKLNGKWSVFAMGLGKIPLPNLGGSPKLEGTQITEEIEDISPIHPSGRNTFSPPDVQAQSTPIFTIPKAVHRTIVEHVIKPNEATATYDYTPFKLKCFSGLSPRPTGEVDFDTWRLQVHQLLDDPEISCKGKKRKLVESLSPPALNEALHAGQSATAEECLAQLEKIYSPVTSSDELYAQFLETFQKPSERPSEYLRRLNNSWRKVVEKKTEVLENQEVQLMKQFIRGCWDESLIMQLHLRDHLDTTNTSKKSYSQLLYQVRVYEEEKEIKEQRRLKQLGRPPNKSSSSCHIMESGSPVSVAAIEPRKVEDRLSHLEGAIAELMKRPVTQKQMDQPKQEDIKISPSDRPRLSSHWFFCYNCGIEGHSKTECTNERNAELVQEKLISRQEQRSMRHVSKSSKRANVKLQKATHKTMGVNEVLNEIVGDPCHTHMFIEGVPCKCLIDTGSQVTCITLGFYEKYLSHIELHPIEEALQVIGAGGQEVPYLGYVVVSVSFPKENCGTQRSQMVFALICPDQNPPTIVPVIVGTNILQKFKADCEEMAGPQFLKKLKVNDIWAKAYAVCKAQKRNTKRIVRAAESQPVIIPPGEVKDIVGKVRKLPEEGQLKMLLEDADNKCFPGGLMLKTQLATTTSASCNRVTVHLQNASSHSITLPPKCVLARGEVVDWIKPMPVISENDNTSLSLDFGESPISTDYKQYVEKRIQQEAGAAFSKHDLDVGHIKGVKHAIYLSDNMPFKERTRSVSPADFEDLRQHLYELLASGIIEESDSPYASPIVLVRKKSGALRMVVDYRRLNSITRKDAYPLPRIEETFSLLSGAKWFTVLDLKSGYYQIEMEEKDKPKTAFTTPMGNWQFRMMPQGLTNAPATFQRMMERVMKDINLTEVIAFLDDLIIFSATLEEHEARLMKVLQRLIEHGLKLSVSKCKFFQTSVKYLGHIISQEGIQPDPDKLSALMDWPRPKTIRELRTCLGVAGYYRRFVKNYSSITKPLTSLLAGSAPCKKKGHRFGKHSQELEGQWSEACQEAFETIKKLLTTAPVLSFSNWRLPYILHTDASLTGLGAAPRFHPPPQMHLPHRPLQSLDYHRMQHTHPGPPCTPSLLL
ncbi:PREDICTED: uncharacterized protein LOC107119009 [Gekko japonicus]|uniref:ribonuclease H n=1 Tax=Gekko japonicus TaxID=146911 RepID=A0ABM1KT82_GEKJA|nr:PREDICTED: uncharacterized protein LOC107119009 [Gekko japonicus]